MTGPSSTIGGRCQEIAMGAFESGTLVEPDLARDGDPAHASRWIVVEQDFAFQRDPRRRVRAVCGRVPRGRRSPAVRPPRSWAVSTATTRRCRDPTLAGRRPWHDSRTRVRTSHRRPAGHRRPARCRIRCRRCGARDQSTDRSNSPRAMRARSSSRSKSRVASVMPRETPVGTAAVGFLLQCALPIVCRSPCPSCSDCCRRS